MTKEWTVCCIKTGEPKSKGFDTQKDAVEYINRVGSVGVITDIKQKGHSVHATTVFVLLSQAGLKLAKR